MQIILYEFNKNPNSTKRPSAAGLTLDCYLLEPTSITAPSLSLQLPGNPGGYNYARIPEFNRYYFIEDWTANNGRWVASLSVDVLASFKESIGASTQYVLRAAHDYNGEVSDTLYPAKTIPKVICSYPPIDNYPLSAGVGFGYYVVGIINNSPDALGCVAYYRFTMEEFRQLCNKLLSNLDWAGGDFGDVTQDLVKSIFNPFQYIVSCTQYPFRYTIFPGTTVTSIPYGWWSLDVTATRITSSLEVFDVIFPLQKHPQAEERGAYLNSAPFSRYTLYWDSFGTFPLDAALVARNPDGKLTASLSFDCTNATATLRVDNGNVQELLVDVQVQLGIPVQLAQITSDYLGAATSAAGAVGSLFNLDFMGAANGIANAVNSLAPKVTTSGSNGSSAKFSFVPHLQMEFYECVDDSPSNRGRPLCAERKLSTLPGYIITADAELEAPCTSGELDRIKGFLNGGFFYE